MKLARVAVLGVAVGAGLIAALIAVNMTRRPAPAPQQQAAAPVATPATRVLVAAADLPIGTKLTAESLTWREWPADGVSPNFVVRQGDGASQLEPYVGAVARASIYAGEPVIDGKLLRSDQGIMAAILPKGMRAVATRVSADTSAGGFILPNDRVDVVMTRKADGNADLSGGAQFLTETILSNVRVLAIDQAIEDKDGKSVVGQTATLELTPQQVQILTVAQQMSDRLTLALRSAADSNPDQDHGEDAVHLIGGTRKNGAVTVVRNGVPLEVNAIR